MSFILSPPPPPSLPIFVFVRSTPELKMDKHSREENEVCGSPKAHLDLATSNVFSCLCLFRIFSIFVSNIHVNITPVSRSYYLYYNLLSPK